MNTEKINRNSEGTVVDVRTSGEFMGGSVAGAVNIPLSELPDRLQELREMKTPLILCCASGTRSGKATDYLQHQGLECINGGSWLEVNLLTSEEA